MEAFNSLSPFIQSHVKNIAKTSGLPVTDDTYELIATAWLEKKQAFERIIEDNDMVEVESFQADDPKGAIALTYSGSLLNIGPLSDGKRKCEYTSIGIRSDVPASASDDESSLSGELKIDSAASFLAGPVKASSPLFKIAVAREILDQEDEMALLGDVSKTIAGDFAKVNKTLIG